MSVLFALLLAQATEALPPSPATTAEESEITVLGRKAAWWRGTFFNKDNVTTCTTQVSTGDAQVDKILCDGLVACAPRFIPEMESLVHARQAAGYNLTREDLPKLLKPVNNKIMRCARAASRPPFLALIRSRKAAGK